MGYFDIVKEGVKCEESGSDFLEIFAIVFFGFLMSIPYFFLGIGKIILFGKTEIKR